MKIRIVKKDAIDGEYYIVQRQNFVKFWAAIPDGSISLFGFGGEWYYTRFSSLESAKEGLEKYKKYLKKLRSLKKDEVVYTETI